jgi:hypothetical protein
MDRQKERQTEMREDACNKRTVKQTIGQRSRDRHTDMCTDGHIEQKTEGLIDIWKDRRTDEQVDRQGNYFEECLLNFNESIALFGNFIESQIRNFKNFCLV